MNNSNPIFTFLCLGLGLGIGHYLVRNLSQKLSSGKTSPQKNKSSDSKFCLFRNV